jgi:hypothetical protein
VAGFGALIYQVGRQAEQSREAIAEQERRKIKAQMYDEAAAIARALTDAAIDLGSYIRNIGDELTIAAGAHAANLHFPLPTTRWNAFATYQQNFSNAVQRLIFLIENRRFVDPRFVIFRTAYQTIGHDILTLVFQDCVLLVSRALPVDNPHGGIFPYTPPTLAAAQSIKELAEKLNQVLWDGISYSEDFMVETQNHLLGDLFASRVAHREPINPKAVVIDLARHEELEQWFVEETAWGHQMKAGRAAAVAMYHGAETAKAETTPPA